MLLALNASSWMLSTKLAIHGHPLAQLIARTEWEATVSAVQIHYLQEATLTLQAVCFLGSIRTLLGGGHRK